MVHHNTNYYRRNKEQRFKVHICPHCNFETTGPKSSLQAHIWAKHTNEQDRPFQCPCTDCNRGYSAKANLHKHLKQCHNITVKFDRDIFAYAIKNVQRVNNMTNDQIERYDFYMDNKVVSKKMAIDSNIISVEKMYYDMSCNIIKVEAYTKQDIVNLKKK